MNDPRNELSRTVQSAPESTPEYIAMITNRWSVPNTWGHLASQVIEAGLADPTPEAARNFLGITEEQFVDPDPIFTDRYGWGVQDFEGSSKERWQKEYLVDHGADDEPFLAYFAEATEDFAVDDGDEQAAEVQEEIKALAEKESEALAEAHKKQEAATSKTNIHETYGEAYAIGRQVDALVLKRDALGSGMVMPFHDFLDKALNFDGDNPVSQERILDAVGDVISDLMLKYFFRDPEVPLSDLVIGREQLEQFTHALQWQQRQLARQHAEQKWQAVSKFIYAGHYWEHPLFSGQGEK